MNMDIGTSKTPAEMIKEGAFGDTNFRDIYSGVNNKWYRKSWKEFNELIRMIVTQIIMTLILINIKLNVEHLRFWENKRWITFIDPYVSFQWFFRY